jgi:CheY-like chemotaxis protein
VPAPGVPVLRGLVATGDVSTATSLSATIPAVPSQKAADVLAGKRILVVDDHGDTLDVMQIVLVHAGAQVVAYASPELAARAVLHDPLDAIVTDLTFGPDAEAGLEVLRDARQRATRCVVVAMTGRQERENELYELGFDGVLIKPVDPFDVVRSIVRLLTAS